MCIGWKHVQLPRPQSPEILLTHVGCSTNHTVKKLFSQKTDSLDCLNRTHYARIAFGEYKMAPLGFHLAC